MVEYVFVLIDSSGRLSLKTAFFKNIFLTVLPQPLLFVVMHGSGEHFSASNKSICVLQHLGIDEWIAEG